MMQPAPGHLVAKSLCTFADAWTGSEVPLMCAILVRQSPDLIVVAGDVLVRKVFQTHMQHPYRESPIQSQKARGDKPIGSNRQPRRAWQISGSEQNVRGCENPDRNRQVDRLASEYWPRGQETLAGFLGAMERLGGRADLAFMPGAVGHLHSCEA
jgi:hypothetical protein